MADRKEPTEDERAGMAWWNSLTPAERVRALMDAGYRVGGGTTPTPADAWARHKQFDSSR